MSGTAKSCVTCIAERPNEAVRKAAALAAERTTLEAPEAPKPNPIRDCATAGCGAFAMHGHMLCHSCLADEERARKAAVPAEARKADDGKPCWNLLPFDALDDVARVMAFGAAKYDAHNWAKGMAWGRLLAACLRHLSAWALGQERDAESGLPHLAHAGACVLMLGALVRRGKGTDDRGGR